MVTSTAFLLACFAWQPAANEADEVRAVSALQPFAELWIADLDADEYTVRELGSQRLRQAGAAAGPALIAAAQSGSLEQRLRATQALAHIYRQEPFASLEPVEDMLEGLCSVAGALGEEARVAWESQRAPREQRTLARLESLGARVSLRNQLAEFGIANQPPARVPLIQYIAISRRWKGSAAELLKLRRLSEIEVVFRVSGEQLPEDIWQQVEAVPLRVDKRGPMLGVRGDAFNREELPGCMVSEITPGSPADKAGLEPRDRIVRIDDATIESFPDLIAHLLKREPGQIAVVHFVRDEETLTTKVELGDW